MGHQLSLYHATRLVLAASSGTKHGINLVNEDNAWLEFSRKGEDGVNKFVGVTIPLFSQRGDMEIDKTSTALVR